MNSKRYTTRYIVIKVAKIKGKERTLKARREKQQVMYKGTPVRLSADFSAEIFRPEGSGIFKVMKGKNLQPRILYLARVSFIFE